MMMTLWPRGFDELIPTPLSLILTVVLVDDSPRYYLFSSATVRMPVYTAQKCGTEPQSDIRGYAPLQKLC